MISHSGKRSYNGIVSVKNGYVENCLGKPRKSEKEVSVRKGYLVHVSVRNGQLNACEESLSQATAGRRDTMARYPLKTDTQNVAWRSCEKEVSVRKGYLVHVSVRNGQLNGCEESLSQATAGRGDTMIRYPLKTDTQNVAWRSCEKEVSVRKGYLGYVFCRRPRTYVQYKKHVSVRKGYIGHVSVRNGYIECRYMRKVISERI